VSSAPRDRGRPPLTGSGALVGYHGYLTVLIVCMLGGWWALEAGMKPTTVTLVFVVGTGLLCFGLERVIPYTRAWRHTKTSVGVDVVHVALSALAYAPVIRAGALALVVALGAAVHDGMSETLWPHHWPFGLQVLMAVVLADFGAYSAHRFMHIAYVGWRLHAVHHSPTSLNFLASARTHPFNAVLTLGAESLPVFALGASPEILAMMTVFKGANGLLQHSNIDLRPGWLSGVVATNEAHWWHHSVVLEESNRNFGNSTMVWDRLFGTWFVPKDRAPREQVGVEDAAIPENVLWHLATPFLLRKFERNAADRPADA